MKRLTVVATCFFVLQIAAIVESSTQSGELPKAFLLRSEGTMTISRQGESISVRADNLKLEDIIQKIADECKTSLKFYCNDPALNQESTGSIRASGALVEVLRQVLGSEYRIVPVDRTGKPIADGKNIFGIDIRPEGCQKTDISVRVFIPEKEHPLLRKSVAAVSVETWGAVLKREGPASRRRAADYFGSGNEGAIPYAKEALKDENYRVMFAGLNALTRLGRKYGSEKVSEAIYARFREKPYPEFLLAIAELDKDRIWPIIDGLMDQSSEKEKGIMARALPLTKDGKAVPYLSKIGFSGMTENSRQAIYGIGKIGGLEGAAVLMKLLQEGDVQRQAWAAQAVHFLSKDDGVKARAEVERLVRDEGVSDAVLQGLAEISYLEPLEKLMKDPASKPEMKIRVLKVLAERGVKKADAVTLGLKDNSPRVRMASVEAMQTIASEEALNYLVRLIDDGDANVRRTVVRRLGDFPGVEDVVIALGKAVHDPDEYVRRGAVDSLYLMGEPSDTMRVILKECKQHKDPYVVRKAESILAYWGM